LPNIENIVFLNISSWAGGASNLWEQNIIEGGLPSEIASESFK